MGDGSSPKGFPKDTHSRPSTLEASLGNVSPFGALEAFPALGSRPMATRDNAPRTGPSSRRTRDGAARPIAVR